MITFSSELDVDGRAFPHPTVARLLHRGRWVYIIVGTLYGAMRDLQGDYRKWRTKSAADRAAAAYSLRSDT